MSYNLLIMFQRRRSRIGRRSRVAGSHRSGLVILLNGDSGDVAIENLATHLLLD